MDYNMVIKDAFGQICSKPSIKINVIADSKILVNGIVFGVQQSTIVV